MLRLTCQALHSSFRKLTSPGLGARKSTAEPGKPSLCTAVQGSLHPAGLGAERTLQSWGTGGRPCQALHGKFQAKGEHCTAQLGHRMMSMSRPCMAQCLLSTQSSCRGATPGHCLSSHSMVGSTAGGAWQQVLGWPSLRPRPEPTGTAGQAALQDPAPAAEQPSSPSSSRWGAPGSRSPCRGRPARGAAPCPSPSPSVPASLGRSPWGQVRGARRSGAP